jgi:hypothetical protein
MRRQHVQLRDRKGYGARPAFWSLHGLVRERPPACLGDLYARDLDRTSAGDHALGLCGRMSDAYQLNHLLDRKAMRDQDRFRASIGAGRKQLERAPGGGGGVWDDACGLAWMLRSFGQKADAPSPGAHGSA